MRNTTEEHLASFKQNCLDSFSRQHGRRFTFQIKSIHRIYGQLMQIIQILPNQDQINQSNTKYYE